MKESIRRATGARSVAIYCISPVSDRSRLTEQGFAHRGLPRFLTLIVTDGGETVVKSAGIYEATVAEEAGALKLSSFVLSLDRAFKCRDAGVRVQRGGFGGG